MCKMFPYAPLLALAWSELINLLDMRLGTIVVQFFSLYRCHWLRSQTGICT